MSESLRRTDLAGRVALVTGGSRGIGLAVARLLGRRAAKVAICARNSQDLLAARSSFEREQIEFLCIEADLIRPDAAKDAVARIHGQWNRLDILVNNCGGLLAKGQFLDLTDEDWLEAFNLNLMTAVRCCREAIPYLRRSPNARIVNISSLTALQPGVFNPHYAACKAALSSLSKYLSRTLAADGILVNTVSPGIIHTEGWDSYLQEKAADQGADLETVSSQEGQRAIAQIPIGRLGTPPDVANLVAFLASDEASYITGADFIVDGGKAR